MRRLVEILLFLLISMSTTELLWHKIFMGRNPTQISETLVYTLVLVNCLFLGYLLRLWTKTLDSLGRD